MAVTNGTLQGVNIVRAPNAVDKIGWAFIVFDMAGTYAQADNSSLVGVPTLIKNATRNGKTVNMVGVSFAQSATKQSDGSEMGLKTVAISSSDVTFEITTSDFSTELANGAIPDQARPFGILVSYYES